jgi:hypothetical protein
LVFVAGCHAAPAPSEAELAVGMPTLSFNADFTQTQSGPLIAGGKALLHYDPARLPKCRMRYQGFDAWALLAWFGGDAQPTQQAPLTQLVGQANTVVDVTLTVPFAHDFAVWVEDSDESGCVTWDSNFGRNYHFDILPASTPVFHFFADFTTGVDGQPNTGDSLIVDYDLGRLTTCRGTDNGRPTWDVTAFVQLDDGPIQSGSVTQPAGIYRRIDAPATFQSTPGAHDLKVWFENTDRSGCQAWDSNDGQNYHFRMN